MRSPNALMFPSCILGWHEIEQAATDPHIRQVYLDTIAGWEKIRQLQEVADSKANQVQYLHGELSSHYATFRSSHRQAARLRDMRSGLQELTESNLIALRDAYQVAMRQRSAIRQLPQRLRAVRASTDTRIESLSLRVESGELAGESPLAEFAQQALSTLTRIGSDVDRFGAAHREKLEGLADELEAKLPEVDKVFAQFTQSYTASVEELPPAKQKLLESHRQVLEDTRALPALQEKIAAEKSRINTLLVELIDACNAVADALDEQTQLRKEGVAELTDELLPLGVSLGVEALSRLNTFEELSKHSDRGAQIYANLSSFAAGVPRHHRRLERAYVSLRSDLLEGFSLFLNAPEFTNYLCAYEQDDLRIGFAAGKSGESYTPIDRLSAGQRCTAVFPILLKLREGPLIVDQPEDNLDNRHIASAIAPTLRKDKRSRQVAFTSHNANLVVLTDAEHIVLCEGSGSEGEVRTRGFLSTSQSVITPKVIALLDGGRAALKLRYQKYGIVEK